MESNDPRASTPSPVLEPLAADDQAAALLAQAHAHAEEIKRSSDDAMDRITKLAGQKLREIRIKRDANIKALMDRAELRADAIRRGIPDPGPGDIKAPARPSGEHRAPSPATPRPAPAFGSRPPSRVAATVHPPMPPPTITRSPSSAQLSAADEDVDPPKPSIPAMAKPATILTRSMPNSPGTPSGKPLTPEEWSYIADTAAPSIPRATKSEGERISPQERLRQAEASLKAEPDSADAFCRLASVQLELGMKAQGMINYLRAAEGYGRKGEHEKTMQIYSLLTMISPEDFDLQAQLVMIALRLNDRSEAVEKLKWLCNELLERGREKEAIECIDRILDEHPMILELLLLKADMLVACGKIDDACRHLGHNVAILLENNKVPEAHALIEKGVQVAPESELWSQLHIEVEAEMHRTGQMPVIGDEEEEADPELGEWLPDFGGKKTSD